MSATIHRISTRADARQALLGRLLGRQAAVLANRRQVPRDSLPFTTCCAMNLEKRSGHAEEHLGGFPLLTPTPETLLQIETTLRRLAAGEHGTCSGCRCRIPTPRLSALPFATLCLACQEQLDAGAAAAHGRGH